MDRLVAFGCSSQSAWPKLVSNKLGMECVNANTTTTLNRLIMHEIITFPLLSTDTVIVVWANPDTKDILYNKDKDEIIIEQYNELLKKVYYFVIIFMCIINNILMD